MCSSDRLLSKVSVKHALECTTMSSLVSSHLMNCIMDCIKNVFDVSGLTVPYVLVGDCSGERTADISSAIRSGYNAGNGI